MLRWTLALLALAVPGTAQDRLDELIAELESERPYAAFDALARMGADASRAVPALVAHCRGDDGYLRSRAAEALGHIGEPADEVVPVLVVLLGDGDRHVEREAADGLVRIGEPARGPVAAALADVRRGGGAARVLLRMGEAGGDELRAGLSDERRRAVLAAVRGIAGSPGDARELADGLDDETEDAVRWAAHPEGWTRSRWHAAVVRLLAAEDPALREAGAWLAATRRARLEPDARELLVQALADPDAGVRAHAAWSLGRLDDAFDPWRADHIPGAPPVPELDEEAIVWPTPPLPGDVPPALLEQVPTLVARLADEDVRVRRSALFALAWVAPRCEEFGGRVTGLLDDPDPGVRLDAARVVAYADAGASDARPVLRRLLVDDSQAVRRAATVALGCAPGGTGTAVELLAHPDAAVRWAAAASLGARGTEARLALNALERLYADPDFEVASAAFFACKRVVGRAPAPAPRLPAPEGTIAIGGGRVGKFGGRFGRRARGGADEALKSGLVWLAGNQTDEGHWPDDEGRELRTTSVAVLAFLADGSVVDGGPHGDTLRAAVDWLLARQRADGSFGEATTDVDHAIAALALAENAYFSLGYPGVFDAAEAALRGLLERGSHAGDDPVALAWSALVLSTGREACLAAPDEAHVALAARVEELAARKTDDPTDAAALILAAAFSGVAGDEVARLAEVVVSKGREKQELSDGDMLRHLGTFALYQVGGQPWDAWNGALKHTLVGTQADDGSWAPAGLACSRAKTTAFHALDLTVYRRYARVLGR